MNEEDDPDWHWSYLKRLRSLLSSGQTFSYSRSPLNSATSPEFKHETEALAVPPSGVSGARMIRQAEHMELNEAQLREFFPTLTQFWRQQHQNFPGRKLSSRQTEFTRDPSKIQTPDEPIKYAAKGYGDGAKRRTRSACRHLLQQKQKRKAPRAGSSKRLVCLEPADECRSLEQILEEEALNEQIETIRQQELKLGLFIIVTYMFWH